MARKTVDVSFLLERANTFMERSDDSMAGMRKGMAALLESALFSANRYKGFKYLSTEWDESTESLREGYDDSRRYYY